jgi:RNA polymerase sigma-70 factor (ECF subfamily)
MVDLSFDHAAFNRRLLETVRRGEIDAATTEVIRLYGPEVYSLLLSIHRRHEDADDVFSAFCEKLWRGLSRFEGRASVRTWSYTIAWRVSSSYRARQATQLERPSSDSQIAKLAVQVRTETLSRLQQEKRSRLRELRQTLPPEDQALLILRVERELDWRELARVMSRETELDDAGLARESARLRKRFQLVKTRLRELIRADRSA